MLIDFHLVAKQTRISVQQKVSSGAYMLATFPQLVETTGFLKIGDAPPEWQGCHPTKKGAETSKTRNPLMATLRDRLTLSQEEYLQKQIVYYESEVERVQALSQAPPMARDVSYHLGTVLVVAAVVAVADDPPCSNSACTRSTSDS